jgi:hypothetical protein
MEKQAFAPGHRTESERDIRVVANAIAESAKALGMTPSVVFSESEAKVFCDGQRMQDGGFDVEIVFVVPTYGYVDGVIRRGMERGNALKLMRKIVSDSISMHGLMAESVSRFTDPLRIVAPTARPSGILASQRAQEN